MKAIITIIVLALVAWGIWMLMDREPDAADNAANNNNAGNVEVSGSVEGDSDVNLGEFEDKG